MKKIDEQFEDNLKTKKVSGGSGPDFKYNETYNHFNELMKSLKFSSLQVTKLVSVSTSSISTSQLLVILLDSHFFMIPLTSIFINYFWR